jgi:hypothetical protein
MIKSSPKTGKLLTTFTLTAAIFSALAVSGFTVVSFEAQRNPELPPNQGPVVNGLGHFSTQIDQTDLPHAETAELPVPQSETDEAVETEETTPVYRLTNVIRNGDFEINPRGSVATEWEPFNNAGAIYGWYGDHWEQAVHSGRSSQLMEINLVEGYQPNRIIAIFQTVDVVPNAVYSLTIHALMRSTAPLEERNQGHFLMQWGIDYRGTGKHNNVTEWLTMPLNEQPRLGSFNPPSHDAAYLTFQQVFTAVHTMNSSRLTLFIRGVKVTPSANEVDYNVDDVSMIGPFFPPPEPQTGVRPAGAASRAIPAGASPQTTNDLPAAGAILPANISIGSLALGGLVLIVLGAGAANELLQRSKTEKWIGQK